MLTAKLETIESFKELLDSTFSIISTNRTLAMLITFTAIQMIC